MLTLIQFLSTLSLRRATRRSVKLFRQNYISIHALLAESDARRASRQQPAGISIHALLAESDHITQMSASSLPSFLSTLSLRRATHYDNYNLHCVEISIHALLAESDDVIAVMTDAQSISIHALLAESDAKRWKSTERPVISIHALLAESDR